MDDMQACGSPHFGCCAIGHLAHALQHRHDMPPSGTITNFQPYLKGKTAYPLFQFDISGRGIHPSLLKLIEMRTDEWGGNLAFLHWLTRPNRSLSGAKPCDSLDKDEDEALRSFTAEISGPLTG